MKNKLKELDVDFIGDGKPLTKQEEYKISDFLSNNKKSNDIKFTEKVNKKKTEKTT